MGGRSVGPSWGQSDLLMICRYRCGRVLIFTFKPFFILKIYYKFSETTNSFKGMWLSTGGATFCTIQYLGTMGCCTLINLICGHSMSASFSWKQRPLSIDHLPPWLICRLTLKFKYHLIRFILLIRSIRTDPYNATCRMSPDCSQYILLSSLLYT